MSGDGGVQAGAVSGGGLVELGGATGDGGYSALAGAGGAEPMLEPGELAGDYRLVAAHSSKCMDAAGPVSNAAHITVEQHPCDAARPQHFTLTEGGSYYTISIDGSGDCLDVEGQGTTNETLVIRATCNGSKSQDWLPVSQDNGTYFLVNRLSSKCLDVPGQRQDDVSLQLYTCNLGGNQRWVFASLAPQPLPVVIDDFFDPSPWRDPGQAPFALSSSRDNAQACDGNRAPGGRGACNTFKVDGFANGATYAGATWVHQYGGYGIYPGLMIATGATRIHFQARGAKGGERIRVKAGGVKGNAFEDTYFIDYTEVLLTSDWQSFALDLAGQNYADGVVGGFAVRIEAASNTVPIAIYVDDIVWE